MATNTSTIPPILAQMADQCNIPEEILEKARQTPQANLVLSTMAISFHQLTTEVERLKAQNGELASENEQLKAENIQLRQTVSTQRANNGAHPIRDRSDQRRTASARLSRRSSLPRAQRFPASTDITAALLNAAENGHETVVQLILGHAEVDVNATDADGMTALLYAAVNSHKRIVQLLLQQPNINADPKNEDHSTPLLLAAEYSQKSVVQVLLAHGGVDVNAQDKDGDSPLTVAAMAGRDNIIQLLLQQSSSVIDVNILDHDGRSPLSWAATRSPLHRRNDTDSAPKLKTESQSHAVVQALLLYSKTKINLADYSGKTPLQYALESGFTMVSTLLRTRGAV